MTLTLTKQTGTFEPRREPVSERTTPGITPIFTAPNPQNNYRADANLVGQLLAWNVAGKHTHDLQFNIQYIVDALNEAFSSVAAQEIIGSSLHHSNMSIWTATDKYTFDLKNGEIPKEEFMAAISELVQAGDVINEY